MAKEHDQHGQDRVSQVLRKVANRPAHPHHVETGKANGERGHEIKTSVPAMKEWGPVPDLRNQLNRPSENDDDSRNQMNCDGQIARCIAGAVPVRHGFVPRLKVPSHSRPAVK